MGGRDSLPDFAAVLLPVLPLHDEKNWFPALDLSELRIPFFLELPRFNIHLLLVFGGRLPRPGR